MIQFGLHWWHRLLCIKREVLMSHVCWVDVLIATVFEVLNDLCLRTGAARWQLFDCTQTCGCHTLPWILKWELAPEERFPLILCSMVIQYMDLFIFLVDCIMCYTLFFSISQPAQPRIKVTEGFVAMNGLGWFILYWSGVISPLYQYICDM